MVCLIACGGAVLSPPSVDLVQNMGPTGDQLTERALVHAIYAFYLIHRSNIGINPVNTVLCAKLQKGSCTDKQQY